jgi:hypothetical protein
MSATSVYDNYILAHLSAGSLLHFTTIAEIPARQYVSSDQISSAIQPYIDMKHKVHREGVS